MTKVEMIIKNHFAPQEKELMMMFRGLKIDELVEKVNKEVGKKDEMLQEVVNMFQLKGGKAMINTSPEFAAKVEEAIDKPFEKINGLLFTE